MCPSAEEAAGDNFEELDSAYRLTPFHVAYVNHTANDGKLSPDEMWTSSCNLASDIIAVSNMFRLQRSFILPGPKSPNPRSPSLREIRARRNQSGIRVGQARMRVKKNCKICTRSCNDQDPVQKQKRIRWGYEGRETTCPDTSLEVVEGKIYFYCRQAL